jgi:CheY-like chemotaxis protein
MSKKILVVEDDQSIRELLVELLETEGYAVSSANNGKDALHTLNTEIRPDLILMDLMMPVMDGYQFRTEQLKNTCWSTIPTIVMSAETNAREKLKTYNVAGFLTKPVELDTILRALSEFQ